MSIFSRIMPDITTEVEIDDDFNLITRTYVSGVGDYEVVTPLEPLYDEFVARMQKEGYI